MAGPLRTRLLAFGVAAVLLTLLDLVWLGYVAADLYRRELGGLLADPPRPGAAVAFYLLFVAGLVHFVVLPALARGGGGVRRAVGSGAFFGLVAYATWDLTNLAVLDGFPASLVPVDLAWGATLAASVSGLTTLVVGRLERPPREAARPAREDAADVWFDLRFRDLDAFGHVYHAEYLTFLDEARTGWFRRVLELDDPGSYVVARVEIDYRSSLSLGDEAVTVRHAVERTGRTSLTLRETMLARGGRTVAQARVVVVLRDRATGDSRALTGRERERCASHAVAGPA